MELGSIFLLLAVVLLVGIYVSSPLFIRRSERSEPEETQPDKDEEELFISQAESQEHARSSLLAEYDRLLNSLQELEFDHALGKIPEEDYPKQRSFLLQSGADVLQKLDEIQAQTPAMSNGKAALPASSKSAAERFSAAVQAKLAADSNLGEVASSVDPDGAVPVMQAVSPGPDGQDGEMQNQSEKISDADLELIIASRRQVRLEKASGFCPQCGKPVQKSDRFCPKCGKAL